MTITLIIADDHHVVRQGIRLLLQADPAIEVIGQAANGDDAVTQTREKRPDVVLMDMLKPGLDGVAATAAIRCAVPHTEILILTCVHDDAGAMAAMRAGAIGCLVKDVNETDLRHAIKAAPAGDVLVSAQMTKRLVRVVQETDRWTPLTGREAAVLRGLTRALTNKEIARELGITETTVKSHVRRILFKLGAGSCTQAAPWAVQRGFLSKSGLTGTTARVAEVKR
jgi:DNA-binding NarL/FixJ family response regulator